MSMESVWEVSEGKDKNENGRQNRRKESKTRIPNKIIGNKSEKNRRGKGKDKLKPTWNVWAWMATWVVTDEKVRTKERVGAGCV